MGNAAGVINPDNMSEADKANFVDSILHGEINGLASIFSDEFDNLKKGNVSVEEVKSRITASLNQKRDTVMARIVERNASMASISAPEPGTPLSAEDFQKAVSSKNKALTHKSAHTFLVGVDGSESSSMAFNMALSFRRKIDNIVLLHTFRGDVDQATLPPAYRSVGIRSKYETLLIGNMPTSNFHLSFVERLDGQTAKGVLTDIIDNCRRPTPSTHALVGPHIPDFLIIGFTGRKSEVENRRFMGSKTDLALRTIHMPIIIAKKPCVSESKSFVFVVDCTSVSKQGLDILLTIVNPRDDLTVLHVKDRDQEHTAVSIFEKTQRYYEEELQKSGPFNSRFMAIVQPAGKSLVDSIVDHVNDEIAPDFLVIAPRAQQSITSITEQLILKSKSNVILCKV